MTLQSWASNGWLKPHRTSAQEIKELLAIVDRDLNDAEGDYLDTCRTKRNTVEYDHAGGVTDNNADELIEFTKELRQDVLDWLRQNHRNLLPGGS